MSDMYWDSIYYVQIKSSCKQRFPSPFSGQLGLSGCRIQTIDWCHYQWPWMTFKGHCSYVSSTNDFLVIRNYTVYTVRIGIAARSLFGMTGICHASSLSLNQLAMNVHAATCEAFMPFVYLQILASKKAHAWLTRKLCYRKDDSAMRAI